MSDTSTPSIPTTGTLMPSDVLWNALRSLIISGCSTALAMQSNPGAPTTPASPATTPTNTPSSSHLGETLVSNPPATGTAANGTATLNSASITGPQSVQVEASNRDMERNLWCNVYAKNLSKPEADEAVRLFKLTYPS